MKRYTVVLVLPLVVGLLYFVPITSAQCSETTADVWDCVSIDSDGVITIGNGDTDVVNLNGNTINNLIDGLNGIESINVTVNGEGIINGEINGISATGDVTTYNVVITGGEGDGISSGGIVSVTGGGIAGYNYGINAEGMVTVTDAVITGTNFDGIFSTSTVDAYDSDVFGNEYGINAVGDVTSTDSIIAGFTYDGIWSSGSVSVYGGSITGNQYGIYSTAGSVWVDSATVTGGTAAIMTDEGNDTLTFTNTYSAPEINGVVDGSDGVDTAVGIQVGSGEGAQVEYIFTCADYVELCTGDPISATAQGHTYTIQNIEQVILYMWEPF